VHGHGRPRITTSPTDRVPEYHPGLILWSPQAAHRPSTSAPPAVEAGFRPAPRHNISNRWYPASVAGGVWPAARGRRRVAGECGRRGVGGRGVAGRKWPTARGRRGVGGGEVR